MTEERGLRSLQSRDPLGGSLTPKKPFSANAELRAFFFLSLQEASFRRPIKKKALALRAKAFSV